MIVVQKPSRGGVRRSRQQGPVGAVPPYTLQGSVVIDSGGNATGYIVGADGSSVIDPMTGLQVGSLSSSGQGIWDAVTGALSVGGAAASSPAGQSLLSNIPVIGSFFAPKPAAGVAAPSSMSPLVKYALIGGAGYFAWKYLVKKKPAS